MKITIQIGAFLAILVLSIPQESSTGLVPSARQDRHADYPGNLEETISDTRDELNNLDKRAMFGDLVGAIGKLFGGFTDAVGNIAKGITGNFGSDFFQGFFKMFLGGSGDIHVDYSNNTDVITKIILPVLVAMSNLTVPQNASERFTIATKFSASGQVTASTSITVGEVYASGSLAKSIHAKLSDTYQMGIEVGNCKKDCTSVQVFRTEFLAAINQTVDNSLPSINPSLSNAKYLQFVIDIFAKGGTDFFKIIADNVNRKTAAGKIILKIITYLGVGQKTEHTLSITDLISYVIKGDFAGLINIFLGDNGIFDIDKLKTFLPKDSRAAIDAILKPLGGTGCGAFDASKFLSQECGGKTLATILSITNLEQFKDLDFSGFLRALSKGGAGIGVDIGKILANGCTPDINGLIQDFREILSDGVKISFNKVLKDLGIRFSVDAGIDLPESEFKDVFDIAAILRLFGKGCGAGVDLPSVLAKLQCPNPHIDKLLEHLLEILKGTAQVYLENVLEDLDIENLAGILKLPSPINNIDLTSLFKLCTKACGLDLSSIVKYITCSAKPGDNDGPSKGLGPIDFSTIFGLIDFTKIDFGKLITTLEGAFTGGLKISLKDILKLVGFPDIPLLTNNPSFTKLVDPKNLISLLFGGGSKMPDFGKLKCNVPNLPALLADFELLISGEGKITIETLLLHLGVTDMLPDIVKDLDLSLILKAIFKSSKLDIGQLSKISCDVPDIPNLLIHLEALLKGDLSITISILLEDLGVKNPDYILNWPVCKTIKDINPQVILNIFAISGGFSLPDLIKTMEGCKLPNMDFSGILKLVYGGTLGGFDIIGLLKKANSYGKIDFDKFKNVIERLITGTVTIKQIFEALGIEILLPLITLPDGCGSKPLNLAIFFKYFSGGDVDFPDMLKKLKCKMPDLDNFWGFFTDIIFGYKNVTLKAIFEKSGFENIEDVIKIPGVDCGAKIFISKIFEIIAWKIGFDLAILKSLHCNTPDFPEIIKTSKLILDGAGNVDIEDIFCDSGLPDFDDILKFLPSYKIWKEFDFRSMAPVFKKECGLELSLIISILNEWEGNIGITTQRGTTRGGRTTQGTTFDVTSEEVTTRGPTQGTSVDVTSEEVTTRGPTQGTTVAVTSVESEPTPTVADTTQGVTNPDNTQETTVSVTDVEVTDSESEPTVAVTDVEVTDSESEPTVADTTQGVTNPDNTQETTVAVTDVEVTESESEPTVAVTDVEVTESESEPTVAVTDVEVTDGESEPTVADTTQGVTNPDNTQETTVAVTDVEVTDSESEPTVAVTDVEVTDGESEPTVADTTQGVTNPDNSQDTTVAITFLESEPTPTVIGTTGGVTVGITRPDFCDSVCPCR